MTKDLAYGGGEIDLGANEMNLDSGGLDLTFFESKEARLMPAPHPPSVYPQQSDRCRSS